MMRTIITLCVLLICRMTLFAEDPKLQSDEKNLIYNGNFSLGNEGFQTDYTYSTSSFAQGYYTISKNPQSIHPGFARCTDHTGDAAGLMMIFDSYTIPDKLVWGQKINAVKGNNYRFKMWATKLVYYEDSYLDIKINNKSILNKLFRVSKASCTWSYLEIDWISDVNGPIDLQIYNTTLHADGNDLAIDDIEFLDLTPYVDCGDQFKVDIGDKYTICSGEEVVLGNQNGKIPTYKYEWTPNDFLSNPNIGNPVCKALNSMKYSVKIMNTETKCLTYDTIYVIVNKPPFIEISKSSNNICNSAVKLTATSGFVEYEWSDGQRGESILVYSEGFYKVKVIDSNGCNSEQSILLERSNINLSYPRSIEVVNKCVGENSLIEIPLLNLGQEIKISNFITLSNDIEITNADYEQKKLSFGQSHNFKIKLNHTKSGHFSDTVRIIIDDPCFYICELIINSVINDNMITITVPDSLVVIGEEYCIPIYAYTQCDNIISNINYRINLSIDKDIFYPQKTQYGNFRIIENKNNNLIIEVLDNNSNCSISQTPSIINFLCGKVLLSDLKFSPITVSDFWNELGISYKSKNGSLNIDNCAFSVRHIQLIKETTLNLINNLNSDLCSIIVKSKERGEFKIEIIDITGSVIFSETWSNYSGIEYEKPILVNLNNFNSGVYFVILKSPWSVISNKLINIK